MQINSCQGGFFSEQAEITEKYTCLEQQHKHCHEISNNSDRCCLYWSGGPGEDPLALDTCTYHWPNLRCPSCRCPLGSTGGALITTAYILLGGLGIPWFAGAAGGTAVLVGPTAGYLVGFIPAAYCTGLLYNRFAWARRLPGLILVMTCANFIFIHGTGMIWNTSTTNK